MRVRALKTFEYKCYFMNKGEEDDIPQPYAGEMIFRQLVVSLEPTPPDPGGDSTFILLGKRIPTG